MQGHYDESSVAKDRSHITEEAEPLLFQYEKEYLANLVSLIVFFASKQPILLLSAIKYGDRKSRAPTHACKEGVPSMQLASRTMQRARDAALPKLRIMEPLL